MRGSGRWRRMCLHSPEKARQKRNLSDPAIVPEGTAGNFDARFHGEVSPDSKGTTTSAGMFSVTKRKIFDRFG
jgi:hypothetical protein